jgi:uracil-DNA glycosylase family 4
VTPAAANADHMSALAAAVRGCTSCVDLVPGRTTVVVGDLPASPRFVLVGEAPGAQEDAAGRPFVGKGGQLLDAVLEECGVARAEVGVLNVLKCRPPANRPPRPAEVANCRPWLTGQLDLLQPRLVVALGLTAVTWFLGRGVKLGAARGTLHTTDGRRVLATYHPSAALRFGPNGAPMAALREDLAWAARLTENA